ncbi:MAG: carbamoyl transferase [Deltaproteobacteria bacterium]|nr:carbamoyl transferase [Deltaproteobacteria bacterium]
MNLIGLQYNVNNSVALMIDGRIMSAISEERFTRLKNECDFPIRSLEWTLAEHGLKVEEIDYWLLPQIEHSFVNQLIKRYSSFSVADYVREQDEYWYPRLYQNKEVGLAEVFKDKIDLSQWPAEYWRQMVGPGGRIRKPEGDFRQTILTEYLGVAPEKIKALDHHHCHAAYAYFASPFAYQGDALALTIDGYGDGANATVTLVGDDGRWERVYSTLNANIGRLYRYITLVLGMKPNEHEYKMMGLAPYAKEDYIGEIAKLFSDFVYVEDGQFKIGERPPDMYFFYRDKFKPYRFDNIAGGIQRFVEEALVKWVQDLIDKHGIRTVVLSGGVGMNVKAIGEVAAQTSVERFFVPGNPADETNCIGAPFYFNHLLGRKNEPLKTLCLGNEAVVSDELIQRLKEKGYSLVFDPSDEEIAGHLADYKVIGRCVGRMEFGARALGNRSILARSDRESIKEKINQAIKNRDFWMPFAPIILEEFADEYLINPKGVRSPHMTVTFKTTEAGQRVLAAALHPADKTVRAQVLDAGENPELHRFLMTYRRLTGFAGMMNTSFNLHGYPIVMTSEDAADVFESSGLDGLWLDGLLVLK